MSKPALALPEQPRNAPQEIPVRQDQEVEIEEERISVWCLMRAVSAIQTRYLEIDYRWGEDGEDGQWRAAKLTGSPNDRDWDVISEAPSLVGLLKKLGAQ